MTAGNITYTGYLNAMKLGREKREGRDVHGRGWQADIGVGEINKRV